MSVSNSETVLNFAAIANAVDSETNMSAPVIYVTTSASIRAKSPCADGRKKLLSYLGKTESDDAPLNIATILESNGEDDAMWCLQAITEINTKEHVYAFMKAKHEYLMQVEGLNKDALEYAWKWFNDNYYCNNKQACLAFLKQEFQK